MIGKPVELMARLIKMVQAGDETVYELIVHREKRTLTQNAYFHVLVGKIADAMSVNGSAVTKTSVKNQLIADYGQYSEAFRNVTLRDGMDWRELDYIHLKPSSQMMKTAEGKYIPVYNVMKGSHECDTKEMSVLLEGAVQEAKQLGIETKTPAELARMLREEQEAEARKARRRAS